jgi:type 1 fimbriae regulatory protein FimB
MSTERIPRNSGDKHFTQTELKALLSVIKSPRDKAIFTVAYFRGLRASEVGMLQLSSYKRADGRLHVVRLKRSLSSTALLSPQEKTALNKWIKVRGTEPGPMFPSNRKTGIGRQQLHVLMRAYAAAAKLPKHKRHFHCLKHSIATHLVERNVEVLQIKEWLGHRSINSTLEYTHLADKQRDELATRLYSEW